MLALAARTDSGSLRRTGFEQRMRDWRGRPQGCATNVLGEQVLGWIVLLVRSASSARCSRRCGIDCSDGFRGCTEHHYSCSQGSELRLLLRLGAASGICGVQRRGSRRQKPSGHPTALGRPDRSRRMPYGRGGRVRHRGSCSGAGHSAPIERAPRCDKHSAPGNASGSPRLGGRHTRKVCYHFVRAEWSARLHGIRKRAFRRVKWCEQSKPS
ncbi:hypothetical protein J2S34_003828 [Nitrobacter winogradskyi]|uniref:Uncharacterized protein n=1 Tax=Nitrobacter winogradskyi TaxID=913 RepID=A0ACC6AQD8_NITWI|nr:hypothetical protein [Nitrobacter winogradskyi]